MIVARNLKEGDRVIVGSVSVSGNKSAGTVIHVNADGNCASVRRDDGEAGGGAGLGWASEIKNDGTWGMSGQGGTLMYAEEKPVTKTDDKIRVRGHVPEIHHTITIGCKTIDIRGAYAKAQRALKILNSKRSDDLRVDVEWSGEHLSVADVKNFIEFLKKNKLDKE